MANVKIVVDTGASHRRSYARCLALIHHARQAGADAVKFSVFKPDEMTIDSDEPPFRIESGPWAGRKLYGLYAESALKYEWIPDLKRAANSVGLEFIIAIYHPNTVAFVADWGVRTVKVASFELQYMDLLEAISKEEYIKNVILSTGSATEDEIATAQAMLTAYTEKDVTLLYCVSDYPALPEQMNLSTLEDLKKCNVKVGLSDHSLGLTASVMAVSMGASMIERHMKLDDENLDAGFAIFPDQFKAMVDVCRQAEVMLGDVSYDKAKTFHRKEIDGKWIRVVW